MGTHPVIEPNPIGTGNPEDPDNPGVPLHLYGPAQNLSVIQKTNAYCWLDIVVNNAAARVRFEGDGVSNLSDPDDDTEEPPPIGVSASFSKKGS